jgi:hypothetical protein
MRRPRFSYRRAHRSTDFFDDKIDIHHIFPEKWCKDAGIDADIYNSVINKTALSARTNRQIGGHLPSKYLTMERTAGIGVAAMDDILQSHCITPVYLRADRFWEFYGARAETLLRRIESATGKTLFASPGHSGPTLQQSLMMRVLKIGNLRSP